MISDLIAQRLIKRLGGEGSGNIGHKGRPGEVGGSAPGRGYQIPKVNPAYVEDLRNWTKSLLVNAFDATPQIISEANKFNRKALYALTGHNKYESSDSPIFDEAFTIEKISNRVEMTNVLGSHMNWAQFGPNSSIQEFQAAQILGGQGGTMPKEIKYYLQAKDWDGFLQNPPLTKIAIKAYQARRTWQIEQLRKKYGDTLTLYRGINGTQVKNLKKTLGNRGEGDEIDLGVHMLSSFTISKDGANNFATMNKKKVKDGAILKVTVPVEQAWFAEEFRPIATPRFVEDLGEIVILNNSKTIKATIERLY